MGTLADIQVTDNVTDVLAAQYNLLVGSNLLGGWSNATTMSGTITLADSDYAIQRFLCNGAVRIVKLPVQATTNHPFFILNTTAATYTLDVQTNAAVSLTTLAPVGDSVFLIPDGSTGWKITGVLPGKIEMYGGAAAPLGYLMCDGTSYLRTDYAALFAVVSTTFGNADGTHFNVPDMRGVYPKGAGTTNRTLGKDANGNFYAATLGAYVTDKMQGHKHGEPAGTVYLIGGTNNAIAAGTAGDTATDTGVPSTDGTNGTPRTGLTTEPQNLGLNYIIKI